MNSPQASPTYPATRQAFSGFGAPKRKLLDRLRDTCRLRHYSLRTEQAYAYWIKKYILCFHKRHPLTMERGPQARISLFWISRWNPGTRRLRLG
ncbi:MAG TPA: phage integrase N-terminal SAM-like domain-containing protein [Verrucomicrobiae bacterium]|nr:phage integrase N-terminal SAM-like domain-containing protein [Verrucomicrobiae bacterium]